MNVRLSRDEVRIRIDPADLDSLASGGVAGFDVGPAGSLRCELAVREDDGCSRLEIGAHSLRILLAAEALGRLSERDIEEIDFAAPLPDGRELRCSVEKDRRTFVPRHKPPRP